MSDTSPDTQHIFNALHRALTNEFPELNILFIPFTNATLPQDFEAHKSKLKDYPDTAALIEKIERTIARPHPSSFFAGLTEQETKSFAGFVRKYEAQAVCFISHHELAHFEDLTFACKYAGYMSAFEAIHLYLERQKPKPKQEDPSQTRNPKTEKLRTRLKSEAFAAMLLEDSGEKGSLQDLVKTLCDFSTKPQSHFYPAVHPLPLAIDGLRIVYKDLKDETPPKMGKIEHLHNMAEEIGETYDDISLSQWAYFCYGAQEMAWAGSSQNDIISAAVYGSDSAHVRSYAHICAELLNITPIPLKSGDLYNPFVGDDANERMHMRLCNALFQTTLETVKASQDPSLFLEKAREQTRKLLQGNPIGWCAPALIEAENAFRLFKESRTAEEDMIENAFQAVVSQLKWQNLRSLNQKFIAHKRAEKDLSPSAAIKIIEKNETFAAYTNAFELLKHS